MRRKSELAQKIYNEVKANKKVTILNEEQGKFAVAKGKKLFWGKEKELASRWAKKWNNYQKSRSLFLIYANKKKMYFKFLIGNIKHGFNIGEEFSLKKGMTILEEIN